MYIHLSFQKWLTIIYPTKLTSWCLSRFIFQKFFLHFLPCSQTNSLIAIRTCFLFLCLFSCCHISYYALFSILFHLSVSGYCYATFLKTFLVCSAEEISPSLGFLTCFYFLSDRTHIYCIFCFSSLL